MTAQGESPQQGRVRSFLTSLRFRIAAAVTLITILTLAITGVFLDYWVTRQAREQLREAALQQVQSAAVVYLASNTATVAVADSPQGLPDVFRSMEIPSGTSATFFDGRTMHAVGAVPSQDSLLLGFDDTPVTGSEGDLTYLSLSLPGDYISSRRSELRLAMQLVAFPGVVLTAVLAWLAASSVSRGVRRAANAAATMNVYNPTKLPTTGTYDEIATLTTAINALSGAWEDRAESEREFSAMVAHELRTPVTSLLTASELLETHDETSEVISRQVHRLHVLIEDLLETFRTDAETAGDVAEFDLAQSVRTIVDGISGLGDVAELAVESSATVVLSPSRLDRVVTNLVQNAVIHGGGVRDIRVQGASLTITDAGDGFPDWVINGGIRPFKRGAKSPGSGLGLAIVKRQILLMGGTVEFSNTNHGGSVTITLRSA